jgi:hypothetical protein
MMMMMVKLEEHLHRDVEAVVVMSHRHAVEGAVDPDGWALVLEWRTLIELPPAQKW